MNLSIVIVNWNSQAHLQKCLASILAYTHTVRFEIIVIDSGSFDGCDRMLRQHYPQVRFIQHPTNAGFARANNLAFEASTGDCVLFLNPDTELVGPAIDTLYASLSAVPGAGVIGCRLLNADRTLQSSCVQSIPTIVNQLLGSEFLMQRLRWGNLWGTAALYQGGTEPREVEAVSGACLMVRRTVFQQVGRFTEDYFMYAEDVDLAYKMRRAGYRNYYIPSATVVHYGGSSSGQAPSAFATIMMREAIWRFLRTHRGNLCGFWYRAAMLVSALGRLCLLGGAWLGGRRTAAVKAALHKWLAVMRWSVNRDRIVSQYYRG